MVVEAREQLNESKFTFNIFSPLCRGQELEALVIGTLEKEREEKILIECYQKLHMKYAYFMNNTVFIIIVNSAK